MGGRHEKRRSASVPTPIADGGVRLKTGWQVGMRGSWACGWVCVCNPSEADHKRAADPPNAKPQASLQACKPDKKFLHAGGRVVPEVPTAAVLTDGCQSFQVFRPANLLVACCLLRAACCVLYLRFGLREAAVRRDLTHLISVTTRLLDSSSHLPKYCARSRSPRPRFRPQVPLTGCHWLSLLPAGRPAALSQVQIQHRPNSAKGTSGTPSRSRSFREQRDRRPMDERQAGHSSTVHAISMSGSSCFPSTPDPCSTPSSVPRDSEWIPCCRAAG
ncbi:hypothetical protein F4780DRAFT_738451 [Xylariomycetidae sp. FL0641]|nr:hypothetical protein F4780DRAFT_738451 [Xylariomycetidae sp. FL0641]